MPETPDGDREPFVTYLEKMRDRPYIYRQAMIDLRGAVGRRLRDAPEVWRYIHPWCAHEPRWWPDQCHLTVASLFASHQLSWVHRDDEEGPTNLGASVERLRILHSNGDWVESEFEIILLSDRTMIGDQLIGLVEQLAKHRVPIDWSTLLRDLLRWWPEGPVAERWSRAYHFRKSGGAESQEETNVEVR